MQRIIVNEYLIYECKMDREDDEPFSVLIEEIESVGIVRKEMDFTFKWSLVFILKNRQKKFILASKIEEIQGVEDFLKLLCDKFHIKLDFNEYEEIMDCRGIYIFPIELDGYPLYKSGVISKIKRILGWRHWADGDLRLFSEVR